MSEPPASYRTFATSTESSLHFWKPACATSSISTMNLNFLWKLRGLPMTVMGRPPYAPAAASSASRARVSWLMRRMMNSAGLFVARPTRAMSLPAKMTEGVLSVSETATKDALSARGCGERHRSFA